MKNKKNRKKKLAIATIVATLLLIAAGTYAFTAYTDWVRNHFQSSGMEEGKVVIIEEFDPPAIKPGESVAKKVAVQNTGAGKYIVRLSFEEVSQRLQDSAEVEQVALADLGTPATNWPVILNSKNYATDYVTPTTNFKVNGVDATTAAPDVYLLTSSTAGSTDAVLAKKVTINKDQLPANFDSSTILGTDGNSVVFDASGNADVYQKVTIADSGSLSKNSSTGIYNVTTSLLYWQFNTSYKAAPLDKEGDWAGGNVFVTGTTANPVVDAKVTPTASAANPAIFEAQSKVDSQVTLQFGENALQIGLPATATPDVDKWAYNADDGYFYYLAVLKDDNKSINLLEYVNFGTSQANLLTSYDLYVGLEAIPATTDALKLASKNGGGDITNKTTADGTVDGSKTTWRETNSAGWGLTEDSSVYKYFDSLIGQTN